jgi:hypothetical protein
MGSPCADAALPLRTCNVSHRAFVTGCGEDETARACAVFIAHKKPKRIINI